MLTDKINLETKLYQFVNAFKLQLKEALLLRQPPDYNTPVSCPKLKDSSWTNNYYRLFEQIKQLTYNTNLQQEPPVNSLNIQIQRS